MSPIHRKPLPSTPFANYPASQRPPTPLKSYPHFQPPLPGTETATQAERYAARDANLRLNTGDMSVPSLGLREPVGARLLPTAPNLTMPAATINDENSASPSPFDHTQSQFRLARKPVQPMVPAHAQAPEKADVDRSSPTCTSMNPPSQNPPIESDKAAVFEAQHGTLRITLIRRDPASGSQWNVGSIVPQNATGHLHEVDVELTSPGYTQFAKLDTSGPAAFRRRVAFLQTSTPDGSSTMRRRSNSAESFSNSINSNNRRSRQAYAFISPWQGMCAFSNGIDGKSLRCRQYLPGANPSMSGVTLDVAELRFNLPWAARRFKEPSKRQGSELSEVSSNKPVARPEGPSNREQWRRSFLMLTHKTRKQHFMSDNNDDWKSPHENIGQRDRSTEGNRLSLDLGREKAGGGFKGHSAKLGKLIIRDEGLKMCDLVVAACMGVWWQQYSDMEI